MQQTQLIKNKVMVSKVIYHNPKNNWGVFSYENDNKFSELTEPTVKVSGNFCNIFEGVEIEFTGEIIVHPTYGPQIALKTFQVLSETNSKQGIIDFLYRSSISGIALANAEKIYEKFKEDSIRVVLHETEAIKDISGIGDKTYRKVLKSVAKYKKQEELLNFCNKIGGIPYSVINTLFEEFGEKAVELLKNDPYSMLSISSLSFKQIDAIALKMGISESHDSRLKCGLLYVLKNESTLKGSTGCNFQSLKSSFNKELGLTDFNLYQYIINKLEEEKKIVVEFNEVFLKEFYDAEKTIAEYLNLCRTSEIHRNYVNFIVEEELNNFPFKLNEQQLNAVNSCLKNKFSIITGSAGTGKSSITKALVNILNRHEENIILLSPTGKAAKRLTECTNFSASTVHRYLGIKDESLAVKPVSVLPKTTILIDEASMLDVLLFEKVVGTTLDDTRLILVGDTHQLPSVQAGNILEDIIKAEIFNVCVLTDIMRQAESSNIIKYCNEVNKGNDIPVVSTSDFIYKRFSSRDNLFNKFTDIYMKAVNAYGLQETQVICAYKMGLLGMKNLNDVLKCGFNPAKEDEKFPFSIGDKVKHTKNNYKKYVFNGETGIVKDIKLAEDILSEVEEDTLYVDFGDRVVEYNKYDVAQLQLAYASTVHASQGSEYKVVFVILDNQINNLLLIRKIIYTALSRAKKKCILFSTGDCVNSSIHNDFYKERITKLNSFLIGEDDEFNFD